MIWLYQGVFDPADGRFSVLLEFDGRATLPPNDGNEKPDAHIFFRERAGRRIPLHCEVGGGGF